MHFSLPRALGYLVGGLWTGWGGRSRIEAKQFRNLRRLVEKARHDSPLFRRLYEDLPPSDQIELGDLPVTRKPELMAEFDEWLTIRSLPLQKAREHLRDIEKVGVPIDDVAVFQTSGTSGEPAVIVLSESFVEYAYGIMLARFERYHRKLVRDVRKLGDRVSTAQRMSVPSPERTLIRPVGAAVQRMTASSGKRVSSQAPRKRVRKTQGGLAVPAISQLELTEDLRSRFGHSKATGVNTVPDLGVTCRYLS